MDAASALGSGGRRRATGPPRAVADNADAARSLITQRFALDDVRTAFGAALDKSSRSIKVHLKPNG